MLQAYLENQVERKFYDEFWKDEPPIVWRPTVLHSTFSGRSIRVRVPVKPGESRMPDGR